MLIRRQRHVLLVEVLIRGFVDHQELQLGASRRPTSADHFRHPTVVFTLHVHAIYLQYYTMDPVGLTWVTD